jgi:mono/diheme cytochrome c family protein
MKRRRIAVATAAAAAVMAIACNGDFERMRTQAKYQPYGPSTTFVNGSAMQPAPVGAVSVERDDATPLRPDLASLQEGQQRYDVYCTPCHGVVGDAETPVADHMSLRKPPSLHEPRIVALTPAQVYGVITNGYGFMPPYSPALSARERWAVAWYVQALQRSYAVRLDSLPSAMQAEAQAALTGSRR